MRSGQELVLRLARLASHESASSLSSSGQSVHSVRSFARKVGDQFKAGGRGKPLPPDKQLKLSEQTTQSLQRVRAGAANGSCQYACTRGHYHLGYHRAPLTNPPFHILPPIPSHSFPCPPQMLDPNFQPPILKQSAEDEERWRIAQRLYSRRRMADLRERQKHLQSLIRFKQAALEALPAVLRVRHRVPPFLLEQSRFTAFLFHLYMQVDHITLFRADTYFRLF